MPKVSRPVLPRQHLVCLLLAVLASALAGCAGAPKPIPSVFSSADPTLSILKKVRCETKYAFFSQFVEVLRQYSEPNASNGGHGALGLHFSGDLDEQARTLLDRHEGETKNFLDHEVLATLLDDAPIAELDSLLNRSAHALVVHRDEAKARNDYSTGLTTSERLHQIAAVSMLEQWVEPASLCHVKPGPKPCEYTATRVAKACEVGDAPAHAQSELCEAQLGLGLCELEKFKSEQACWAKKVESAGKQLEDSVAHLDTAKKIQKASGSGGATDIGRPHSTLAELAGKAREHQADLLTATARHEDAKERLKAPRKRLNGLSREFHAYRGDRPAPASRRLARDVFKRFGLTAVSYTFDLTAHRTDDNRINFGLEIPGTNAKLTLSPKGGAKIERKNVRQFTLSDTISDLRDLSCADVGRETPSHRPDYLYPMKGQIGLSRIVAFYVSALAGSDAPKFESPKGQPGPEFNDTITFTTTIDGSVNPTLSFTEHNHPAGTTGVRFTEAGWTSAPVRVDTHKLTLVLTTAPAGGSKEAAIEAARKLSKRIADARREAGTRE